MIRSTSHFILGQLLAGLLWSGPAFAASVPQAVGLNGQLFDSTGTPLTASHVNFALQVLDSAETCVLYSEAHLGVDLSASSGRFSLILGGGSSVVNNIDGSTRLSAAVFANVGVVPVSHCSQPTVALSSGDPRQIRVSYDIGGGYVALTPDVPMVSTASAMIADSLQGKAATDFVQILDNGTTVLNQANTQYTYSSTNWPKLKALLDGTSTQYLPTTPTSPVDLNAQRVTDIADPTLAQDAATKHYADTTVAGKAADVSAVGLMTGTGDVMQWDGTLNKWVAAPLTVTASGSAGGDLTGTYPNPTIANDKITAAKIKSTGGGPNLLLITDISGANITYGTCLLNQVYAWTAGGWACTNVSALAPVTSVAGKTGVVTLNAGDISGLGTAALFDVGTAASRIPQLDASARMPAVDGSQLTNVNAVQLQTRAVSSAIPLMGQVLGWNGSAWTPVSTSMGTLTDVETGVGLLGGPILTVGTLSVDVGTSANKILQLNAGAQIPAVDGSLLTNVNANRIATRTVSSAGPVSGQVLGWNSTTTQWEPMLAAQGSVINIASGNGLLGGPITTTGSLYVDAGTAANKVLQLNAAAQIPPVDGSLVTNVNAVKLQSFNVAATTPAATQVLGWNAVTTRWEPTAIGAASSVPLSSLTAATALNTIDNLNLAQAWTWSTATTHVPLSLSANGLTSGSLLSLNSSSAALNSNNGLLSIVNAGSSTSGVVARVQSNSATGSGLIVLANGNVGVGSSAPAAALDVTATGAASSAMIVPRDTALNRPSAPVNGMLRYNTTGNALEGYVNGVWSTLSAGSSAGTVTNIATSTGLLGGPITTSGTLAVDVGSAALKIVQENASAQIAQTLGSLTNPAYSFAGDLNTGVFSSGADQLNLVTNGTTALGIDASGNVAIGTTGSTVAKLDVVGTGTGVGATVRLYGNNTFGGAWPTLILENNSGTGNSYPQIVYKQRRGVAGATTAVQAGDVLFSLSGYGSYGAGAAFAPALRFTAVESFTSSSAGSDLRIQTTNVGSLVATDKVTVAANGSLGVGTTLPQAGLDVSTTGTTASAVIVPRDTTSNRPSVAVNGMIRYASDASKFEVYQNGTWQNMLGGSASSLPLSGLTGATVVNTIDSLNFAQTWNWSSAATEMPLTLSANSLSTGSLLSLNSSSPSLNSTNGLLSVVNGGSSTNGIVARVQSNAGSGSGLTILANGNVGVGTGAPQAAVDIAVAGTNSALILPRDSTGNRPVVNVTNGMLRYNTSTSKTEAYENGAWTNVIGSISFPLLAAPGVTSPSAPSYSFSGNSNTGIFQSAPGQLSFASNGTSAMTVDVSGKIGIGTSSPGALLEVTRVQNATNAITTFNTGTGSFAASAFFAGSDVASLSMYAASSNYTPTAGSMNLAGRTLLRSYGSGLNAMIIDTGTTAPLIMATNDIERFRIDGTGKVGIGTLTPQSILDVYAVGTAASAVVVPRDTTANRPSVPVNGMIRYASDASKFEVYQNGTWQNMLGGSASSLALSGLTAATAANSIDSQNFPQTWAWSTATTQTPLAMNSNALTSGSIMALTSSSTSLNSVNGLLTVANTGTATSGVVARFQANGTAGSGLTVTANNRVGIGTAAPTTNLQVNSGSSANTIIMGDSNGKALVMRDTGAAVDIFATGFPLIFNASGSDTYFNAAGGRVGIGTYAPSAFFDVWGTGSNSAMLVPRDATAARPTGVNGMIRYATDTSKFEVYQGGTWQNMLGGSASSLALSGLTAATALNSIDNLNFPQTWAWSTATTQNSFTLGANALTTGSLLSLNSSSPSLNSNAGLLSVVNSGTSTSGLVAQIQANGSAGSGLTVLANGRVGVNSAAPAQSLDVVGNEQISGDLLLSQSTSQITKWFTIPAIAPTTANTAGSLAIIPTGTSTQGTLFVSGQAPFGGTNNLTLSQVATNGYLKVASPTGTLNLGTNNASQMTFVTNGNVGVGTSTPAAALDVALNGTASSAIIVPRDTIANRPTVPVNGMIRYASDTAKLEAYQNGLWQNVLGGSASSLPLSGVTAATAVNSIDNLNFAQAWNWSTATTHSPFAFSANALTSGSLLGLTSSSPSLNSTGGLFSVANTGTSTSGVIARVQSSATGGSGLTVLANGNVGVGTGAPTTALQVTSGSAPTLTIGPSTAANDSAALYLIPKVGGSANPTSIQASNNSDLVYSPGAGGSHFFRGTGNATMLYVANGGSVGVGTTNPAGILDVYAVGTTASALIVPRDTVANRPSVPVNGMIRYASDTNKIEGYQNGAWVGLTGGSASNVPLSGLTAAGVSNSIDNLNFAQTWNWSTATTQTVHPLSATALTTGGLLALTSSSSSLNSTGGLLSVVNSGTSTSGMVARVQSNATSGSGLSVLANGSVGIGTASPSLGMLQVNGTAAIDGGYLQIRDLAHLMSSSQSILTVMRYKDQNNIDVGSVGFDGNELRLETYYATHGIQMVTSGATRVEVDTNGNVGIGTTAPLALLDVYGTGSSPSAIIVPRDTTANRPSAPVNGMLRYNTALNAFEGYGNGGWAPLAGSFVTTVPDYTSGGSVVLGAGALSYQTAGTSATQGNTGLGYQALQNSGQTTAAIHNTAVGFQAGNNITVGNNNTFVGFQANTPNGNANGLTLVGANLNINVGAAGYNATVVGSGASCCGGGTGSTVIGSGATGTNSFGVSINGQQTGNNAIAISGATGADAALAIGGAAKAYGVGSIAIGYGAGSASMTGSNNVVLGPNVGKTTLASGANNILIGNTSAVDTPAGSTSSFLNIGNGIFATGLTGTVAAPAGLIGIGTAAPAAGLDVATTGTIASALIVPRDTSGNRPVVPVNGMIRYATDLAKLEAYQGGAWQVLGGGGATSVPLSGLTAATNTNTIDNLLNAQTWNWSTATTQTSVSLNANALTTGSLLALTSSSPSLNSTGGLLSVVNSGTSTNGLVALVQSNSTAGSGLSVLANGNVGIGLTNPTASLYVAPTGAAKGSLSSANGDLFVAQNTGSVTNSAKAYVISGDNGSAVFYLGGNTTPTAAGIRYSPLLKTLTLSSNSLSAVGIDSVGRMGIGTTTPQAALDVASTGTGASALIVPRDTVANRPSAPINGMIRYASDTSMLEAYQNGTWQSMIGGSASSLSISGLTAATAANFIDNTNFAQTWNWSTATTQQSLTMTSNALTTGSVLSVASVSPSLNSTNGILNVVNTGTSTSGLVARLQSNATTGSGMYVLANGKVGVGTTNPSTSLYVSASGSVNGTFSPSSGDIFVAQNNGAAGNAANAYIISGDGSGAAIYFGGNTTPTAGGIGYAAVNRTMTLRSNSLTAMTIDPIGRVGIGTTAPLAALDLTFTGTAASALIVPRDTVANRPVAPVNGMIRYASDTSKLEAYQNGAWTNVTGGAASSLPLSGLTAATAVNTIDNANFAQTWNWSTATTQSLLSSNANALTTGMMLNLASTSNSLNSPTGLLAVTNSGTSTSGTLARFQSNSGAGSGLTVLTNGNVGIGSVSPVAPLDVENAQNAMTSINVGNTNSGASAGSGVLINSDGGRALSLYAFASGAANSAFVSANYALVVGTSNYTPLTLSTNNQSRMKVDSNGNVGIATPTPQAALDVAMTGSAASAIIVPRDTVANRPSTPVNGMIRYASDTSKLEAYTNGVWSSIGGGGSGLVNFTESVNTAAPNTSVPVVSFLANNAAANVDVALTPKGGGALTAQVADSTAAGGNKRGANAVDWQTNRSSGTGVASGSNSVVSGGGYNIASGTYATVAGGYTNNAASNYATVSGGSSNSTVGIFSTVGGGYANSVNAFYATIPGGSFITASGQNSFATNANTTTAAYAQSTFGSYNLPKGSENSTAWIATDPLLTVGNGTSGATLSTALMLLKNGSLGIGTNAPLAGLDVSLTGPAASAIIVPRDTMGNRPSIPINGMIRYASDTSKLEAYQNGTWQNIIGGSASSLPLSGLTAATAVNTIDNANFAQTWNWSTATTQATFTQNANALTTGSMLVLSSSNASLNSTNGLLNVANTGTSTIGLVARVQSNATAGSGLTVLASGNVGVGTATPSYALDVNGTIRGYGITDSSDARLKSDVRGIDDALARITRLRGVTYVWSDPRLDVSRQVGLIAQDVEAVFPEVVKTDEKGFKSLNYSHLVAPVIEAVKSLYARLVRTESRVDTVDRTLLEISERLRALEAENARLKAAGREVQALRARMRQLESTRATH